MSKIPDPHDRLVRSSLANNDIAKAFFERHLPSKILKVLDLNSITLENSTYFDDKLQKTISDMVFDCQYHNDKVSNHAKVVLLVEHQSKAQKLLPFRVYHYMFNMLYHKIKQRPKDKINDPLPAVFALVFYNGEQSPYPYSLNLSDCFDDPHSIMAGMFTSDIPLVDVNQEKDDELTKLKWLGILSLALKYSRNKDAETFLLMMSEVLKTMDLSDPETNNMFKSVITYIFMVSNTKNIDKLIEHSHHLPEIARGEFMTVAEQLEARGLEKGRYETQVKTAIRLLEEGAEPKFVEHITELPLAKVLELQAELNN